METFVLNFKSVSVLVQQDCVYAVPLSWLEDTLPASGWIEGAVAVSGLSSAWQQIFISLYLMCVEVLLFVLLLWRCCRWRSEVSLGVLCTATLLLGRQPCLGDSAKLCFACCFSLILRPVGVALWVPRQDWFHFHICMRVCMHCMYTWEVCISVLWVDLTDLHSLLCNHSAGSLRFFDLFSWYFQILGIIWVCLSFNVLAYKTFVLVFKPTWIPLWMLGLLACGTKLGPPPLCGVCVLKVKPRVLCILANAWAEG